MVGLPQVADSAAPPSGPLRSARSVIGFSRAIRLLQALALVGGILALVRGGRRAHPAQSPLAPLGVLLVVSGIVLHMLDPRTPVRLLLRGAWAAFLGIGWLVFAGFVVRAARLHDTSSRAESVELPSHSSRRIVTSAPRGFASDAARDAAQVHRAG